MASTSSSTVTPSSACSYDVFLSFRGEDTRHSFTDHLYDRLTRAGICTFRDEEEINRCEVLKPEIERAIKASRASIVVLSKNYATSAWCLDELVLILQQRRESGHIVLPVFYHVDPTDVRKQTGSFAIQVKPSSSRWTDHNVSLWTMALMQVADLAGLELVGSETSFLKEIVDTIYNKLDRKEVHLPLNITGMTTRYEEIKSWLDQCDFEILTIYGMGGSGKTTLAKYIYDSNKKSFEYVSFVEDIGSRCKEPNDLLEVQEQLLKDILGGKKRKIPGVSRGTCMIKEALQTKRTLIVLDDIVGHSQLVALLGMGQINAQSKIIVTTRENTNNWPHFPYWRYQKYEMRLLNDNESLELLSRHAFGSKTPIVGFEELVLQAVRYCKGNPLALEVLGSSLFENKTIPNWKSQLSLLEKDIDSRIQGVLVRSYMSLPYNSEKELFLHIACFFIGKDMDYVIKILEPDYSAISGIKTLINRCLLSVSPNKKLMMHRLLQDMAKNIVRQESVKFPAKRSRVWLNSDYYMILKKGKGSKTVEGLALDMQMLLREDFVFKSSNLKTDALKNMDSLKLLQLNFVELDGSYENFSEGLRWLCWLGFYLSSIPFDLYMGNLVAIDMSYSNLEVFEPPMVLQSLQILNLKDSHNLLEIRNIFMIPHLETLILWNCYNLVNVCKTIANLTSLALLNMTGCKNLFNRDQVNLLAASTSSGVVTTHPTFSFPRSLRRLFLKDCSLESADSFCFSFSPLPYLQYLNLGNSLIEFLTYHDHLKTLRVLDLSLCSRLKWLLCLPSTLAELYIYNCELLERVTFQSHRFTLQEFGYEGCSNLYEIEGFINLVPMAKLNETDLGHMKWLKRYQNHEVYLVGDDELLVGRSSHIQMLFEFGIMSTSLVDIKDTNMTSEHISESTSLSFVVPSCPENKTLRGINLTCKYAISGDDWAWFCKISTANGVDLMYNPRVFGKPESGKVCIWLSYWPIGNTLGVGDTVSVSIIVMCGLEVNECGVSLVYSDQETMDNIMGWEETPGGDLSGFQLSTGAYYLCRRDFFELMEVGRLTPDWFRILVGDTIEYTEVRGWRKTGRPKQVTDQSFTELKTVRCIIDGPELEDVYKIARMSKSSIGDKTVAFTSSLLEVGMKFDARSERIDNEMEEQKESEGMSKAVVSDENRESSPPHGERLKSVVTHEVIGQAKKMEEKYEPLKELGSGNFGVARLVRDKKTKELLAVKYIERGPKIDENVHREIINHRSLRHPNIIRFKEVLLTPTHLAIVMEYAAGGDLFVQICNAGRFSEDEARFFFQQLISGASYCHSMEICHRDLKLENTLLDGSRTPRLKICDFGYSKSGLLHSQPKSKVGTPTYIAPEVISRKAYDGKIADVWSCGVTLYVMLVGAYPFEDPRDPRNFRKTIERIMSVQYSIPDYVYVSKDCRHLLSRIFVANPSKRITIEEIKKHPWFKKNMPKELVEGERTNYENTSSDQSLQSIEDINRIIQEAKTPGEGSPTIGKAVVGDGSLDPDKDKRFRLD